MHKDIVVLMFMPEMKNTIFIFILIFEFAYGCSQQATNEEQSNMSFRKLTPEEEQVIVHKGTERPFTGKYNDFYEDGIYECKRCGAPLYVSTDKFKSDCGWPSFDDEIPGAVKQIPDADGRRTEIVCSNCGAHLGHIFTGEGFTPKNTRHCVNSISLEFMPSVLQDKEKSSDTAIFAGGCFWGVEYYMQQEPGVISTEVGYTGGNKENPTYKEVCSHTTGHAEAIRIVFNPSETSYEKLARLFFEIHDPTQVNGQGPDIGEQYRSEIFYKNIQQLLTAQKLIGILKGKGYKVATKVTPASKFWPAEDYHQDYYENNGHKPYCHVYTRRF